MWRTTSPNLNPQQVANQFVNEVFPGRKVEVFTGQWVGLHYSGEFTLRFGTRWHKITADHYGNYEVEA